MKKSFIKKVTALGLCLVLVLAAFVYGSSEKVSADLYNNPFYSGRLLVKALSEEEIPEGGEIISSGEDMYLVDYESAEKAELAYLETESNADILASPEASVVACKGDVISTKIPSETEESLLSLTEEVPDYSGRDVIALIDTGAKNGEVLERFSVLGDEGEDENGHGSAMVSAMKSVDENANIVSIKALNKSGTGSISSVYSAISLAVKMNVKVINLSLVAKSVDENIIIKDIIREALNKNIIVVGAAGNTGEDAKGFVPGCIDSVIIAGACDENGNRRESSNFGENVDWFLLAESTSEASAKLSAFINKNCKADSSLNVTITEALGEGLIFGPFEENKKETEEEKDANLPDDEKIQLDNVEWKEIDVDTLSKEDKEGFSEGGELTDLKISESGDLLCVTTRTSTVPDDGSFVPAAWQYAQVLNTAYIRRTGTTGTSGTDKNANPITITTNGDGTYSASNVIQSTAAYHLVGYTPTYIPGTFEKDPGAAHLTEREINSQSMQYCSRYLDDTQDITRRFGDMTFNYDAQSGMNELCVWPEDKSNLQYLYKINIWLYVHGLPFNTTPYRDTLVTDDTSVWMEEGGVGRAKYTWVGTKTNKLYNCEVGFTLRKYKVYYQLGSSYNNLYYAGEGFVGTPFNFQNAEAEANKLVLNKKLAWDYSVFGSETRPANSKEIFPQIKTLKEADGTGEEYFKFVIKPKGSSKTGRAEVIVKDAYNNLPVAGVEFKLQTAAGVDVREHLISNDAGKILVDKLYFAESLDSGDYDGNYVLIPVSAPPGLSLPREVPIFINREKAEGNIIDSSERTVDLLERSVFLESIVNNENAPRNVFSYEIWGTDALGMERHMSFVSSGGFERKLPAGNYKVSVEGNPGYSLVSEEILEGFNEEKSVDLIQNERGSMRFIWEYQDAGDGITGSVAVNRFSK